MIKIFIIVLGFFILLNCQESVTESTKDFDIEIKVAKWFNNHKAAISITCDLMWSLDPRITSIVDETVKRNLKMDFEFVTSLYDIPANRPLVDSIRNKLYSKGVHVFGHGHKHVNHDKLSFDEAYTSFKICFDKMNNWGLNPRAYAYPQGRGHKRNTQLANKLAGFYCARGFTGKSSSELYYICPEQITEPKNWFFLPSIVVGEGSTTNDNVTTHDEMVTYLNNNLEKTAWVTILYHSIGIQDGWAYYPMKEYIKDLDYMMQNDFWVGNMDMIAAYIYERNSFNYELKKISSSNNEYLLKVFDGLNNKRFNQLLTLNINNLKNVTEFIIEDTSDNVEIYHVVDGKVSINILPSEEEYKIRIK